MKRISPAICVCITLLICAPAYSKHSTVTLNLKQAKHFHAKASGSVYIVADQFKRQSNANHYKRIVQSDTRYPVKVVHSQGYYAVVVGPMTSSADVRKVASKLKYDPALSSPKKVSSHAVVSKKQPKQQRLVKVKPELHHKATKLAAVTKPVAPVETKAQANTQPVTKQTAPDVKQPEQIDKAAQAEQALREQEARQEKQAAPAEPVNHGVMYFDFPSQNWIVTAGAGVLYPQFESDMTVNNNSGASPSYNQDIYTTKSRTQPITQLLVGRRWMRNNNWLPAFSVNLSYQHLFSKNVGGEVIQYSDPAFTNYTYDWEVSSDVLLALLKVNVYEYKHFSPYLLGGAGSAFNLITNYNEGALPGATPRTNPAFGSNSQIKFSYLIGAGLDFQINPQVILSAEYQRQSIGTVASRHGTGSWAGQLLNLGSYKSNAILFNVTYLFGNGENEED